MELLSHYIKYQKEKNNEIVNWENHLIGERISYSYRDTEYNRGTYPSNLHYHDYYELVVFEGGEVSYVCEGRVHNPKRGDVILVPPSKFHMSVINCESTRYKRHVFYFYPSAFDTIGYGSLTCFLEKVKEGEILTFNSIELRQKFMDALSDLREVFKKDSSALECALGLSYVIQVFYLLNQKQLQKKSEKECLPKKILKLQEYVDKNFAVITSVKQVAKQFFYSREYVSRLFRKYFDTTISDYIMKRRISKSQSLIIEGHALIDVAFQVGFGSLSTFIRAFKMVTGMLPSEYRKLRRKIL